MNDQQIKALLRQLAYINTRETKDSQRMDLMNTRYKQMTNELQKLRAVMVSEYHNREAHGLS